MMSDYKDKQEQEELETTGDKQGFEHQEEEEMQEESVVEDEKKGEGPEVALWREQCIRISAEFENYKKRVQRDQAQWIDRAKEQVFKDLLTFVDDFERALQQKSADISGIEMMYKSLLRILEKHHIKIMQNYEIFDPEYHEAVMQVASDNHESGQIVEVFSKGFMLQDRILRPAKVSVAQ